MPDCREQRVIADLKPYQAYKDSGLTWLDTVPSHWGRRRMKFLFSERTQKGFPEEPLLAATQTKGVVRKEDYGKRTVTAMKDFHLLKLVQVGDFVISLRSFEGGIEVSHCRGIISPAYTVLKPSGDATQAYYSRLFKSADFISGLTLFVTGIREGQNIDYERMSRDYMPLPPVEEQVAIGRFLDWANARLERTIRAKRRVIKLLTEQKQAIIHRAVTRGLDPTVPLKPSGIAWLGDIPAHWDLHNLGRAIRLITGFPFPSGGFSVLESDMRLVRGINVTPSGLRWDSVVRWKRTPGDVLDDFALKVGDIVLGMDRPIIGAGVRAASVEEKDVPSLLLQRVARLRPTAKLDANYLLLLLRGRLFADYVTPIFTGISVPHLSPEQIKGFKVALPPVSEQQAIRSYVEAKTTGLNTAISRLEREIDLLREYGTRLVADVVTGKLDVREAAARLPDEAPLDSVEDAADLGDEIESEAEEIEA